MLIAAIAGFFLAQSPAPAPDLPPAADPTPLVRKALGLMATADTETNRFTYMLEIRMAPLSPGGGLGPVDQLQYEVTYINGLKYDHLVQRNGAPLTGKDLTDEAARYQAAIQRKKDLTGQKRAKADGYKLDDGNYLPLDAVLSPNYKLSVLATHKTDQGIIDEIDAALAPGVKLKSQCPWHLRLFINEADGVLYRFVEDAPSSKDWKCSREVEDVSFSLIEGVPEPKMESLRFNEDEGGQRFTVLNTFRYTNYKRFHSTVTLVPDSVTPDTSPADPKTP